MVLEGHGCGDADYGHESVRAAGGYRGAQLVGIIAFIAKHCLGRWERIDHPCCISEIEGMR